MYFPSSSLTRSLAGNFSTVRVCSAVISVNRPTLCVKPDTKSDDYFLSAKSSCGFTCEVFSTLSKNGRSVLGAIYCEYMKKTEESFL